MSVLEPLPLKITIGDKYGPAMKMTTAEEATEYLRICIQHNLRCCAEEGIERTPEEARKVELTNLGYYSGYYNYETQVRVEKLFGAVHPIFGSTDNGPVSPEKAFEMGVKYGESAKSAT